MTENDTTATGTTGSMLPVYGRAVLGMLPGRKRRAASRAAAVPSRTLSSTTVIDPDTVARFCRVVDAPVTNLVPPAYLHALGFPLSMRLMTEPGFPIPIVGLVHVRTAYTQRRPVQVGEEITVDVSLEDPVQDERGVEIGIRVRGAVGGEEVFDETWTCLAKGRSLPGAAPSPVREHTAFTAPVPTAVWLLDPGVGPRYARVSGDYNPIHMSALAAKAFGFPRSIAHGMYTAARAFAAADVRLDAFHWDFEFAKPVILPATVGFRVTDVEAPGAPSAAGSGAKEFAVWNPKSGKPHLLSSVTQLS